MFRAVGGWTKSLYSLAQLHQEKAPTNKAIDIESNIVVSRKQKMMNDFDKTFSLGTFLGLI